MEWAFKYPYKFGPWYWLEDIATLAPFWARTDTYWGFQRQDTYRYQCSIAGDQYNCSHKLLHVDPNKWSSVYYRVYDKYNNKRGTEEMLLKASQDVHKYHDEQRFKNFKATWVLVVTWVHVYPGDWYEYDWTSESLYFEDVSSLSSNLFGTF